MLKITICSFSWTQIRTQSITKKKKTILNHMSVYRMIQYDSYDTYLSIVWFMSIFNMLLRYEIFFTWHDMIFIVRFTKTIFIYMISPPLVKNGWLWAPYVITQINCYTWCVIDFTYIHIYYLFFVFPLQDTLFWGTNN